MLKMCWRSTRTRKSQSMTENTQIRHQSFQQEEINRQTDRQTERRRSRRRKVGNANIVCCSGSTNACLSDTAGVQICHPSSSVLTSVRRETQDVYPAPSTAFRHLPPWRKDVVNQCLEFGCPRQLLSKVSSKFNSPVVIWDYQRLAKG